MRAAIAATGRQGLAWMFVVLAVVLVAGPARPVAGAPPRQAQSQAVLELPGEEFAVGQFGPSAAAAGKPLQTFAWQSPAVPASFEFAWGAISRVRLAPAPPPAIRAGAWRADLRTGGVAIGELEAVDAEHVSLAIPGVGTGPLRLRRDEIVRLTRDQSTMRVFVPGTLADWKGDLTLWREEGGRLAGQAGPGGLCRDVAAPARACFEMSLVWDERPEFDIALAAGPERMAAIEKGAESTKGKAEESYRVECVPTGELLVVREGKRAARMAIAATLPAGAGRLWLRAFVDQETGRLAVTVGQDEKAGGAAAVDQSLPPEKRGVDRGFVIRLRSGRLRIEQMRVRPWTEPEPLLVERSGLGSTDAVPESFDKAAGVLLVSDGGQRRRVPVQEVTDIALNPAERPAWPADGVMVGFHGGTLLPGRVLEIAPPAIRFELSGVAEPLVCDLAQIAVIESLATPAPAKLPGRAGMLEGDGVRMSGCLAPAAAGAGIAWQPRTAMGATPLAGSTLPLRVHYGDTSAKAAAFASAVSADKPGQREIMAKRNRLFGMGLPGSPLPLTSGPPPPFPGGRSLLFLKTGDAVLGTVLSIDGAGVRFKKDGTGELVVPHAAIQAIELVAAARLPISKTKADRLLLLPRMQQADPPTHLLRLAGGDYMRGKLLSLDDATARFEVAGTVKELRRADVTRLIWLAVAGDGAEAAAVAAIVAERKPEDVVVRAVMGGPEGERRLTCVADRVAGDTLTGRNGVLGDVTIDLTKCVSLEVGPAATGMPTSLPYAQWRLKPAALPKALKGGK